MASHLLRPSKCLAPAAAKDKHEGRAGPETECPAKACRPQLTQGPWTDYAGAQDRLNCTAPMCGLCVMMSGGLSASRTSDAQTHKAGLLSTKQAYLLPRTAALKLVHGVGLEIWLGLP